MAYTLVGLSRQGNIIVIVSDRSLIVHYSYSNSPLDDGTMESGNALLDSMIEEKKRRWEEVITSTNMTHNSRQAWKTIRMLSNDPTSSSPPCLVNANQVAHQLLVNGRGNMPSKPKRPVIPETEAGTSMVSPFSEDEYRKGVATLKNNKAAGRDDVLVEQLKNLNPNAHKWLRAMLQNNCFIDNKIPTIWRQSKIIAMHTETRERLGNSEELSTHIAPVPHVQTL